MRKAEFQHSVDRSIMWMKPRHAPAHSERLHELLHKGAVLRNFSRPSMTLSTAASSDLNLFLDGTGYELQVSSRALFLVTYYVPAN
jgi:hypothetical protein